MIQNFLDWAQAFPNVWLVSNQQMMGWLRDPKRNSEISQSESLGCKVPDVPADEKICNGIPQNMVRSLSSSYRFYIRGDMLIGSPSRRVQAGLLNRCPFEDFPWQT